MTDMDRFIEAADALEKKAQAALDLNDNTSPFGGEIQRDRVERTFCEFRNALTEYRAAREAITRGTPPAPEDKPHD